MQINRDQAHQLLRDFEFETLWIEELGWDRHRGEVATEIRERGGDESEYILTAIAQKRGMAVFLCPARTDGSIPDYAIRRKIQREVARSVHEHLIIYTDAAANHTDLAMGQTGAGEAPPHVVNIVMVTNSPVRH